MGDRMKYNMMDRIHNGPFRRGCNPAAEKKKTHVGLSKVLEFAKQCRIDTISCLSATPPLSELEIQAFYEDLTQDIAQDLWLYASPDIDDSFDSDLPYEDDEDDEDESKMEEVD